MKGQFALEHLTIYGISTLLTLIVLGGLTYLVIIPNYTEYCQISAGFECVDFQLKQQPAGNVNNSEVAIFFKNNFGEKIYIQQHSFEVHCPNCVDGYTFSNWSSACGWLNLAPFDIVLGPGEIARYDCNPQVWGTIVYKEIGAFEKVYFEFKYTKYGGSIFRRVQGVIHARVQ